MIPSFSGSEINEARRTNEDFYDLICIGFGPASLAIAVALRDLRIDARILFLERQSHFAWHAGMLIPSAKMQISFLKDLATFRDPRSHFTFINYLKNRGRLEAFANLGTFFPLREEFNDYLKWAAGYFNEFVKYNTEAQSVQAIHKGPQNSVNGWLVTCRNQSDDTKISLISKKVVVAVGGSPKIPRGLQSFGPKIKHSSQYLQAIANVPSKDGSSFHFAVIGAGQSAAEIFEDLSNRFPKAHIKLFIAASALKPSDDSPLYVSLFERRQAAALTCRYFSVNEIFNPDQVDDIYALEDNERSMIIAENRPTNYSVVRSELLDRLYEKMYHQRLHEPDKERWQLQIQNSRELCDARETANGKIDLYFIAPKSNSGSQTIKSGFDLVFVATGYTRDVHAHLLDPLQYLLEESFSSVERDYRLKLKDGLVNPDCGIWLQGCCEASHGLSDTLLSILAVRGGEIVDSMFRNEARNEV